MKIKKNDDGSVRITQDSGLQTTYSMSEIYEIASFVALEDTKDEVETYLTGLEECRGVTITERYLCDDIIETIAKTVHQDRINDESGDQIYDAVYKHILSMTPFLPDGQDAVFLPGKIHGCEDQLYILSFNPNACDKKGSWDIEVIDRDGILELIDEVKDNCEAFFELLPDKYQGRWYYCDAGTLEFHSYCKAYDEADFLIGRDGETEEEYEFIKAWAKGESTKNLSLK